MNWRASMHSGEWVRTSMPSPRGVALRGLGRYDESIAELDALIASEPDYFAAVNNLGLALRAG